MEIKNKELSLISNCTSDKLRIESSNLACDFEGVNLEGSAFSNTNLCGADFKKGDMRGASFEQIGLASATFKSANMVRCVFEQVGMSGASLKRVDLDRSDFDSVGFTRSVITNSDLRDVTIRSCRINGMTVDGYDVLELIKFYKMNHKKEK